MQVKAGGVGSSLVGEGGVGGVSTAPCSEVTLSNLPVNCRKPQTVDY